MESLNQDLRNN